MEISCDKAWFIAHNPEFDTQIFYTIGGNHHHCRVNELHGRRIRGCFHGWVILSNHPDSVLWSLWNPLTSKLIRLPPLAHKHATTHTSPCLSSPNDQGSVFLLTSSTVPTIVFCRLDCKGKRIKWTEMSYAKQLRCISGVDDCFLECPTCCSGKVYALTLGPYYSHVIQVDIVVKGKQQVVISLSPFVKIPHTCYNRCPTHNGCHRFKAFLKGSSCMQLFYIEVGFKDEAMKMIVDVYLFRLDITSSMMWEEITDLKDAMFFLELASDYAGCYYGSGSGSDAELEGYIHILGDLGKIIYSFHAKDRTLSLSSMPCVVRESQASAWAMLEWRLEIDHAEEEEEEEDTDTRVVTKPVEGFETIDFDSTTGVLNIPIHILEMIMEHCIGIEYLRFRATCKYCYFTAPLIQWSSKTTIRRLQMYSLVSPLLMLLDNRRGIMTFINPTHDDTYTIKIPKELKGDYQIYCSRYGWLLMYKIDGSKLVFFNPFTSNIRELPIVPCLESFCFSSPPTSPDCMVVGFTTCGKRHVFIHFVSKESTWRLFSLNFGGDDPYSYHFPTFSGQDVYALCDNKGLDVFIDMTKDDRSWKVDVDKPPISGCKSPAQYFLSSCDQHLLLVILGEFGESVEVFKLNDLEEWEKLDGLGKHMICISNTSCICLEAKLPQMENKIYFPRLLHNEGTTIVFYSLETGKYHTFDDKNIQESFGADLFGTKRHCNPHTWIEPSWS